MLLLFIFISGCANQVSVSKPQDEEELPEESISIKKSIIDILSFKQEYNLTLTPITFKAPPKLHGMNYFAETMDRLIKDDIEVKNDFKIIRQVLNTDAIRLWGYGEFDDLVFKLVDLAHQEGLEVWLTYQPFFEFPDMTSEEYI